ncbi:hypothetical protein FEM48_Zijuj08G0098600 [Ziziphus jujuba var. spinosa]|uniref:Replication factor C subunit 3 n=1 Tax=Ziziphus jujuba var. spinosa TaxID=714518 RepID=A0A978UYE7_ZIZJJ|nr:hypothetical protein FEM48_Zijuj08G0098600 [Ziziphus jujuba var. spinosa]
MERSPRHGRTSNPYSSTLSKNRRSGYEPSDTETDFQESPWHDHGRKNEDTLVSEGPRLMEFDLQRKTDSLNRSRRHSSRFELDISSSRKNDIESPARRRYNSKSPYKPSRDDNDEVHSPLPLTPPSEFIGNVSPLSKSVGTRFRSPHKPGREGNDLDEDEIVIPTRKQNQRPPAMDDNEEQLQLVEVARWTKKPNYSRRSVTAPRQRLRNYQEIQHKVEAKPAPLSKAVIQKQVEPAPYAKKPSIGEINEMVANAKLSRIPACNSPIFESTDSFATGDIFFSREGSVVALPKNVLAKNGGLESLYVPKPNIISERDSASHLRSREASNFEQNARVTSSSIGLSQTTTTSSSAISRQSSGGLSFGSGRMSNGSARTTESMRKFTDNRIKSQSDAWFACMWKGPCSRSKSPKRQAFDEAAYIQKAYVVEHLNQFWADKHQPGSLNGFTCHKQEAQLLRQLVSEDTCPHILLKGPTGSGKRSLAMALLREIYGDACRNISYDLRYFQVQEQRPTEVVVPIASSAYHLELNVHLEQNAIYALLGLVREISKDYEITPEISDANFKANYKVIVLYGVDKAAENIQHLIKWILDCYTDACKLVLCCEDDSNIIESVKNRCKVIKIDAPVTHEIMEVLTQIARKEDFDLPMSFAAKIATKSKQNLRKAIMALETCKAHNYPFMDDQPIQLGWEEVLAEVAAEILSDPSPKRLLLIRGRFQKLLSDFVHPKLILQKLVELFLRGIDCSIKRELYYWHAYYDKRLPAGTSALLKLEEFMVKFMSIYRKSCNHRHCM